MSKPTRTRLKRADRKAQILKIAIHLSIEVGYTNITVRQIAERAHINHGLIYNYFDSMEALRKAVMRTAIKQEILNIIIQGLCMSDPIALNAPESLKRKARQR